MFIFNATLTLEDSFFLGFIEEVVPICFVNKVFLKISQDSQENNCDRASFLIKLQDSGLQLYYKKDPGTGIFL